MGQEKFWRSFKYGAVLAGHTRFEKWWENRFESAFFGRSILNASASALRCSNARLMAMAGDSIGLVIKNPPQGRVFYLVARGGFEPPTPSLWVMCSNQLSYLAINLNHCCRTGMFYLYLWTDAHSPDCLVCCQAAQAVLTVLRALKLHIKAKMNNIAILYDVIFAF